MAVRGPHRRDFASNVLEPDDTVDPTSFERHLALQVHTELDKEGLRGFEVVDHDQNVVHPHQESGLHNRLRKYSRQEAGSEGCALAFSSKG
jgi:hypothetical protein